MSLCIQKIDCHIAHKNKTLNGTRIARVDKMEKKCFCLHLNFLTKMNSVSNSASLFLSLSLPIQCLSHVVALWTPVMPATSPPLATHWSTHLTRAVAGSSQPLSPHSASSSTSTHTLRWRSWTAGKGRTECVFGWERWVVLRALVWSFSLLTACLCVRVVGHIW